MGVKGQIDTSTSKPIIPGSSEQHVSYPHSPQETELKRKRGVEIQTFRKKRKLYDLVVVKYELEKITQPVLNLVNEGVKLDLVGGLKGKQERSRKCKRSSEIRLVSLTLYIIGEGIFAPFSKKRMKDSMVKHWAQTGVHNQFESVSSSLKALKQLVSVFCLCFFLMFESAQRLPYCIHLANSMEITVNRRVQEVWVQNHAVVMGYFKYSGTDPNGSREMNLTSSQGLATCDRVDAKIGAFYIPSSWWKRFQKVGSRIILCE
ncbi:uncharacterized protein G2W53_038838 [Senna tora]|uniref:Uncharacterized protein n=1 Tax=Senna tora TaxID=362788 RepID=A0A834W2B0_9FABA|nr:uncharacterized protein G2W53_038838 [Senna tora]